MQEHCLYSTGELSKRANVSVRTIRYYDEKGLLTPSVVKESGYRFYNDSDLARLQKIIILKKLGFSLDEISDISRDGHDKEYINEVFKLQAKILNEKISRLKQMEQSIRLISDELSSKQDVEWNKIISLIHLLSMEEALRDQYKDATNINARIELHQRFSLNKQGWFRWIFDKLDLKGGMKILETGCGNGQLWRDNIELLPDNVHILLSDISSGMLKSAKQKLGKRVKQKDHIFTYQRFDFDKIPYPDESFDIVIANHVLFYSKDRHKTLAELKRVLRKGGLFFCSTYGHNHMKEIELLAKEYDERISLSEIKLYDLFGLENGAEELRLFYNKVELFKYEDSLLVTDPQPLADYIYSCHGNQMTCIGSRQAHFERFLQKKTGRKGLHVTKDAGLFVCTDLQ